MNITWNFANRVVVVSGSAAGIGAAAVAAFSAAGARVYGLDIDLDRGRDVARETASTFLGCDVADASDVQAAFSSVERAEQRLDILVNNAGGFWEQRTVESTPESEWDRLINLNLKATFLCSQRAISLLRRSSSGRIINVSSLAAQTTTFRSSPAYAAGKAGVLALTRNLAFELARDGITANAIAPSAIGTARIATVRSRSEREATEAGIPVGHYGEVSDVVACMLFVASDESRYITGQTFNVNGGRLMI